MTAAELLQRARDQGIRLSARGDALHYEAPPGALSAALRDELKSHKRALLTLLAREAQEEINPYALAYLNRLSDALFVMGRYENHVRSVAEPLWQPGV